VQGGHAGGKMTDPDRVMDSVRTFWSDWLSALAFLTVVPAGRFGQPAGTRPDFRRGARSFPLVGTAVGLAGGLALMLALAIGLSPLIAAVLAVLTTVLLTGALHEDGLADTADGFGGGALLERKLAIMDDSRLGTYGAVAIGFSLLLRISTLAALAPLSGGRAAAALIAAETASRAMMVRFWWRLPAAKPGSLSEASGSPDEAAMYTALLIAAVVVFAVILPTSGFWAALFGSFLLIAASLGFEGLSASQIGGRTGDTLGACQQASAAAFLVGIASFA
jgi:adenosylcobinamide-GDP ribazoletransferase